MHPDLNKRDPLANVHFAEVRNAYETLRDPQKRGEYDQHLKMSSSTSSYQRTTSSSQSYSSRTYQKPQPPPPPPRYSQPQTKYDEPHAKPATYQPRAKRTFMGDFNENFNKNADVFDSIWRSFKDVSRVKGRLGLVLMGVAVARLIVTFVLPPFVLSVRRMFNRIMNSDFNPDAFIDYSTHFPTNFWLSLNPYRAAHITSSVFELECRTGGYDPDSSHHLFAHFYVEKYGLTLQTIFGKVWSARVEEGNIIVISDENRNIIQRVKVKSKRHFSLVKTLYDFTFLSPYANPTNSKVEPHLHCVCYSGMSLYSFDWYQQKDLFASASANWSTNDVHLKFMVGSERIPIERSLLVIFAVMLRVSNNYF